MAQQLWFLRHGEAEPHGARPDAERELTDRGREPVARRGPRARRARADVPARVHEPEGPRARDRASSRARRSASSRSCTSRCARASTVRDALALLRAAGDDKRVLVVGHEPDFSQVVHDLTGARVDLKKGGVAGVRMEAPSRGELVALLRPRELDRLARATSRELAHGRRRGDEQRVVAPARPAARSRGRAARAPRRSCPIQIAAASTSTRLAAPSTPTICPPSRRPLPRSATSLTQIGPVPGK